MLNLNEVATFLIAPTKSLPLSLYCPLRCSAFNDAVYFAFDATGLQGKELELELECETQANVCTANKR